MIKRFTIILGVVLVLSGCVQYDIDEILLAKTEISISLRGKTIYDFDPVKGQYAFVPTVNEFRMMDDDAKSWLIVKFDQKPNIEGDNVHASVQWKTKTGTGNVEDAEFKVERVGGDGMIWLWCGDEKMGLIIKDI